jgi:hypothetical protein
VERGAFRAPGSLRSPLHSGRALKRAFGERHTHPVKRTTSTPFSERRAPARRPESTGPSEATGQRPERPAFHAGRHD